MRKIVPGRKYPLKQLQSLISASDAKELEFRGYVLRFDYNSQMFSVEPWQQVQPGRPHATTSDFGELTPIVKRTPQQRIESLTLKMLEDVKRSGTIPGADDETMRDLVGEYWKRGRTEVTAEMVRAAAAKLLGMAEAKHEEKLDKQITRSED